MYKKEGRKEHSSRACNIASSVLSFNNNMKFVTNSGKTRMKFTDAETEVQGS